MPGSLFEIAALIAAASIPALTLGGLLWLWIVVGKLAPKVFSGTRRSAARPGASGSRPIRAAPYRDASQAIAESPGLTEEAERHKIA